MAILALPFWLATVVTVVYIIDKLLVQRKRNHLPLPPGPRSLPLIGNLLDLPRSGEVEAEHWAKHKSLYGPISSVTALGQTIIIINDADIAVELLEKRSAKHSSRPRQVLSGEMVGWENAPAFCPYNDKLRAHRKNMSRFIGSKQSISQLKDVQEAEVGHFLLHVLNSPEKIQEHARREAGAIILKLVYDYTIEPHDNDLFVDMAEIAIENFNKIAIPGAFMVDILPWLRRLPDWLPGMQFKRLAHQLASELNDVVEKPYAFVKHQMASGNAQPSFLSILIETSGESEARKFIDKWSAMNMYVAGADTSVAAMSNFFIAMMVNPDAQRKAQEEIDRVIGQDRLPNSGDRDDLPYVEAIVKEVLRWQPVAPMLLPHTCTEDDVYEGYFIPKDAIIVANAWDFTHDPERYPDPMSFKPERFLVTVDRAPATNPSGYVFGLGRRVCPGKSLADSSLFLNIAQFMSVFEISKPLAVDGSYIEPNVNWEPGVVCHPKPYEVVAKPRSEKHEAMIRDLEKRFPWQPSDAEVFWVVWVTEPMFEVREWVIGPASTRNTFI